jgi:predicted Zn-dependent protease
MENRPVIMDPLIKSYADLIVKKLVPKGKRLPDGVNLSVTVLESPQPELYSYVDGHMIMTMGVLYAMENEAQLAGVLSHEVASIAEGYYIGIYQEIKAAERNERRKAAVGALFGALLDVAVDYAVDMETIDLEDEWLSGEATYSKTMKKLAALHASQAAYYSIKDVIESIPEKDNKGLAELYSDWERYDDAVEAYRAYLKLNPKADRKRIKRKIKVLERKANRKKAPRERVKWT